MQWGFTPGQIGKTGEHAEPGGQSSQEGDGDRVPAAVQVPGWDWGRSGSRLAGGSGKSRRNSAYLKNSSQIKCSHNAQGFYQSISFPRAALKGNGKELLQDAHLQGAACWYFVGGAELLMINRCCAGLPESNWQPPWNHHWNKDDFDFYCLSFFLFSVVVASCLMRTSSFTTCQCSPCNHICISASMWNVPSHPLSSVRIIHLQTWPEHFLLIRWSLHLKGWERDGGIFSLHHQAWTNVLTSV